MVARWSSRINVSPWSVFFSTWKTMFILFISRSLFILQCVSTFLVFFNSRLKIVKTNKMRKMIHHSVQEEWIFYIKKTRTSKILLQTLSVALYRRCWKCPPRCSNKAFPASEHLAEHSSAHLRDIQLRIAWTHRWVRQLEKASWHTLVFQLMPKSGNPMDLNLASELATRWVPRLITLLRNLSTINSLPAVVQCSGAPSNKPCRVAHERKVGQTFSWSNFR